MRDVAIDLVVRHMERVRHGDIGEMNQPYIAEIVDCIIAAAVEEIERRMEGKAQ